MRNEAVFRRRRTVVLVALIVVVIAVVLVVKALSSSGGVTTPKAEPDVPPVSQSTPSATTTCNSDDIDVVVATEGTNFAIGSPVAFVVSLTYRGEQPCLIDASPLARPVVVTSGKDRIWSSADCAEQDERMLLLANGQVDRQTVTWNTERSDKTCTENLPTPRAGTYKVKVSLGSAKSEPAVFTLQ